MEQVRESLAVQVAYDAWAATYDQDANATRDLDAVVLQRQGWVLEGCDVLELGCGTGKNTPWLATHSRSLVAIDFSERMLERARERVGVGAARFVRHDLTRPWPLADSTFDFVLENLVLEHIAELGPIFREAFRVMRSGGRLSLCELHPARQYMGTQARFMDRVTGTVRFIEAYTHDVSEFLDSALNAGFQIKRVGEWREEGAPRSAVPRLFSALVRRS